MAAVDDLLAARFPAIARDAGGYESCYVKAAHPSEPKAVWIRHTGHKRPGAEATGSLWCTLSDREAGPPAAVTLPWVANGALSLRGERHALGGSGRLRHTQVDEAPTRCRFELSGTRVRLSGDVSAPQAAFVMEIQRHPDG